MTAAAKVFAGSDTALNLEPICLRQPVPVISTVAHLTFSELMPPIIAEMVRRTA